MVAVIVDGDLSDAALGVNLRFHVPPVDGVVQVVVCSAVPLVINGANFEPEYGCIVHYAAVCGGYLRLKFELSSDCVNFDDEDAASSESIESDACTSECESQEPSPPIAVFDMEEAEAPDEEHHEVEAREDWQEDQADHLSESGDETAETLQQTSVTFSSMMRFFQKKNEHFRWITAEHIFLKLLGFSQQF